MSSAYGKYNNQSSHQAALITGTWQSAFSAAACDDTPAAQCQVTAPPSVFGKIVLDAPGPQSAVPVPVFPMTDDADPLIGRQVGNSRLLRRIGRGGSGTVYEAAQEMPKRRVAVKLIRDGVACPEIRRRFEHEVDLLARLRHEGIARIYTAGRTDVAGLLQPFLMLEYIEGPSLTKYARTEELNPRQRLELFLKVCDAVQYAHERGVIHRDLNPNNILVEQSSGQPKIIDFGIGRLTNNGEALTTLVGQLLGTLPYMAPEQAVCDANLVDELTDVYALGVVCFELLAGHPYDFKKMTPDRLLKVITEEGPPKLGSIDPCLRGGIETIVGKALEKEKLRRYQSVAAFAKDIRRFLNDEPVVARPAGTFRRIRKFAKRNTAFVVAVVALFWVLAAGVIVSVHFALNESRTRADAVTAPKAELRRKEMQLSVLKPIRQRRNLKVPKWMDGIAEQVEFGAREPVPLSEGDILEWLGLVYWELGQYDRAVKNSVWRPFVPARPASAGRFLRSQDFGPAVREPIRRESLDMGRQINGEQHLETCEIRIRLALLLVEETPNLTEAEELSRQNLVILRVKVPGDHPLLAKTLMWQRWVSRSSVAPVSRSEPSPSTQFSKGRLLVTIRLVRS